jgi:hypothetical protein
VWDGFDRTMVVYWSYDPEALILIPSMPCKRKTQIADGTVLISWPSRQTGTNRRHLLPKCCQIYNERTNELTGVVSPFPIYLLSDASPAVRRYSGGAKVSRVASGTTPKNPL